MGYARQTSLPAAEPVSLPDAKTFIGIPTSITTFDSMIAGLVTAAREDGERLSGRALAQRTFTQVIDSHPYYTDTIQSQLAYPPNYYSLPRYSTTLWNYSQMIKLAYPPILSVQRMRYIGTDKTAISLIPDVDFILDRITEPARIFPIPGSYWPADLYVANAVEIDYTAGYDPDPTKVDTHTVVASPPGQQPTSTIVIGIPQKIRELILNLVAFRFNNRGVDQIPNNIELGFLGCGVMDWAPTRG